MSCHYTSWHALGLALGNIVRNEAWLNSLIEEPGVCNTISNAGSAL
jgi:hypothetical protein